MPIVLGVVMALVEERPSYLLMALLAPFTTIGWNGYEVRFPAHRRTLAARYNSLASRDFDDALRRTL